MFAHVRSCSACSACSKLVQGMFTRPEHAEHAIDGKNGIYFSDCVPFQHFMLMHVQRVQHVLSLFRACSQGLNMLNMQLTAKMANIFLIMFHFSITC